MKRLFLAVAGLAWFWTMPTLAHHSFAAEFDVNVTIELKGTLTKLEWVNPHGWLYVDVADPNGKTVNWAIEVGAANALLRRGLRSGDFPIGSAVIIKGYRAKNKTPVANGTTVTFADGRNFFLGASDPPPSGAAPAP